MQLGTYRLISRLGAGGMGEVWRAEDTKLLRHVAVKILPSSLASDPEWKARFLREARTVAQLSHPNIAMIYSIEEDGETFFIAMELVEGESLGTIIARGPMRPADAVRIVAQSADALSDAHEKGIIHRDIKPDNILVSKRTAKVLDFGIAKQIGSADPALTQGGMIIGTPHYMSPEQALGKPVDARTDIFSLGVVLYEALTGQKPFDGSAVTETIMNIIMTEPPDVLELAPHVPPQLAEVVRRCMKKQPEDRFKSCDELYNELRAVEALLTGPKKRLSTGAFGKASGTMRQPTPPPGRASTPPSSATPAPSAAPAPAAASAPAPAPAPPPAPARADRPAASRVTQPDSPLAGKRALVADDDPATRYLIAGILKQNRISFDEVDNGAEAVKLLKQHDYTLVFLDLLMPRIDGWGVIDFMRSRRRDRLPRTFVITGVPNQKLSVADQDVVTGLLYKPLDPKKVEQLLSGD